MSFSLPRALFLGTALSLLSQFSAPAFAQQGMPPSSVGVVVVKPETISLASELPGRISATRIAEVRPRIGGIIESRDFEQGSQVSEGDVLFRLDRATYEIAVDAAHAAVAGAEATLAEARQNERRATALSQSNVTSRANLETAVATRMTAEAALAQAKTQVRAAEVNLGFTEVKAPISGRIGRVLVTEGALVGAQGEVLATIQQLDPVYADMQQPVSELLRLRAALAAGQMTQVEPGVARVLLHLDDGSQYPHPGKLLFAEASVERSSGQVTLRAEFPNPDDVLLPGMYVRVSVEQATVADAIAIPSQSVQRDASGASLVYVINAQTAIEARPVQLGRTIGNRVIVSGGLSDGDVVVVDGFQKTGPGAPAAPVCWTDPSAADQEKSAACVQRFGANAAPAQAPAN